MALITTPFDATSTAAEVLAGVDLTGRRAIVTGGASGIGTETARALAEAGAEVTLAVRRVDDAQAVAADIRATTGNSAVTVCALDLTDLDSVEAFVAGWDGPLDILVNNAGVMAIQTLRRNGSGHEMHFATNHLGHFALTVGLHGALAASGAARVVSVSSSGHLRSPFIFDDFDYHFREYIPLGAYSQSKTANVLFAVGVARRWAADGVVANALMPGAISTPLERHVPEDYVAQARERYAAAGKAFKTVEQGASTSVLLAGSPLLEGVTGRYFDDCNEAPLLTERGTGFGGVAPYALDPDNADRLWDLSLRLVAS
jgi:NAD(P)-dependent dehydrogenase (short-subunit alcohol dehydrogenase family)